MSDLETAEKVDNKPTVKCRVFDLDKSATTTIGRSTNCDITIDKKVVSTKHASIFFIGDQCYIEDHDSSNGTRVNGLPVSATNKLNLNDIVRIGDYTFALVCEVSGSKGKHFYFEIRKIQARSSKSAAKTPVVVKESSTPAANDEVKASSTAVEEKLKVDDSKDLDKKSEESKDTEKTSSSTQKMDSSKDLDKKSKESKEVKKTESSDKTPKTDAKVKANSQKSSKKKSKKKVLKEKRHAAYLKKLGASVAGRLKDVKINRKSMMTKIKQVSILSIITHIAFFYIVETFYKFGGDGTEKSIKEIIVTMKDEEQILKIPEQPIIEEPEVAVQEASVGEISLAQVLNPEAQSLSTIMSESVNDALTSDVSLSSGGSQIGDISLGKGMNGRDGTFMKRVLGNKGRYGDVDVRLTLIWNGTSDLDLHSTTPHEEAIFYGRKEVGNGILDIDKNATDPVPNPVENIIWQDSEDGVFTVSLVLFSPKNDKPIPFKVEFAIFGDVYYYKGQVNKKYHEKKNIDIVSFEVRGDRYKILKSINEKPVRKIREVEVDLVIP